MDWKPNIDAGLESGEYEIYGPFSDGWRLIFRGERIGKYPTIHAAQVAAQETAQVRTELSKLYNRLAQGSPLGTEFEKVWDANAKDLYEP